MKVKLLTKKISSPNFSFEDLLKDFSSNIFSKEKTKEIILSICKEIPEVHELYNNNPKKCFGKIMGRLMKNYNKKINPKVASEIINEIFKK